MTNVQMNNIRAGALAIPELFASDASGTNLVAVPATDTNNKVSFKTGFTPAYDNSSPLGQITPISRANMNWLLRAFSQASFFGQTGIRYTFDSNVSTAIGGYPLGAILSHDDGNSIRNVISLKENNTYNFVTNGVDGLNWKYINDYLYDGIYPDYGTSEYLIYSQIPVGTTEITRVSEWTQMPIDGWIYSQFNVGSGVTSYLVLGPADGSIPNISFTGNTYSDIVAGTNNDDNYTALLLGNNYYSNKNLIPVKAGTNMAVFGSNNNASETASMSVWIRMYRRF